MCTGLFACCMFHITSLKNILKNNEAFVVTVRCLGHMCTDLHFGKTTICNINLLSFCLMVYVNHFCICVNMCPHLCVNDKLACFVTRCYRAVLSQFCLDNCSYDNFTSYRNNQPVMSCSFRSFSTANKCTLTWDLTVQDSRDSCWMTFRAWFRFTDAHSSLWGWTEEKRN